jgi:hypothetical protein
MVKVGLVVSVVSFAVAVAVAKAYIDRKYDDGEWI